MMQSHPTLTNSPWKNGCYQAKSFRIWLFYVEGQNCTIEGISGKSSTEIPYYRGKLSYGNFGRAHADVVKKTGKKRYDVEITLFGGTTNIQAVVNETGTQLTFYANSNEVDSFVVQSKEAISAFRETGEPANAALHHYKIQPEKQGKLVFISGAPGLGKSTCGHILSKTSGFVYYEADAFMFHLNPYIPANVDEPSQATGNQNFLIEVSQTRIDAVANCGNALSGEFQRMLEGDTFDFKIVANFFSVMCKDILEEKKRIGGDWVVAHAVPTRALRDHIRGEIGPDLIFVVLNMGKEDHIQRIKKRQGYGENLIEMFLKAYDVYEPAKEDEPNTIDLSVSKDTTRTGVVEEILARLNQY